MSQKFCKSRFSISTDGWLIADGQKVARIEDGCLVFRYKSKTRAKRRESLEFGISVSELLAAIDGKTKDA